MIITNARPGVYLVRLLLPADVARTQEEPVPPPLGGSCFDEMVVVAVICEGDPAFVTWVRDVLVCGGEGRQD